MIYEEEHKYLIDPSKVDLSKCTKNIIVQSYLNPKIIIKNNAVFVHDVYIENPNDKELKTIKSILEDSFQICRIRQKDKKYFLTLKGAKINGKALEYETSITKSVFNSLNDYKKSTIEKERFIYTDNSNYIWEIDHFLTPNLNSLWLAEIENRNYKIFPPKELPEFILENVTKYNIYNNDFLSKLRITNVPVKSTCMSEEQQFKYLSELAKEEINKQKNSQLTPLCWIDSNNSVFKIKEMTPLQIIVTLKLFFEEQFKSYESEESDKLNYISPYIYTEDIQEHPLLKEIPAITTMIDRVLSNNYKEYYQMIERSRHSVFENIRAINLRYDNEISHTIIS